MGRAIDDAAMGGAARDRPKVSVVIPCYNYGKYLPGCVTSALEQDGVDVEVVIVDDASPDGSLSVALECAARDDRVRVIAHEQNRGHIVTFNDGIDAATGDYLVLISADDMLTPGSLARAATVFAAHPRVGLVFGRPIVFEFEPTIDPAWATAEATRVHVHAGKRWLHRRFASGNNALLSPEACMRLSVQRRIGGYDPACAHTSDLNMWLRAAAVSDVGYVADAAQAAYRVHGLNMSTVDFGGIRVDIEQRLVGFDRFFDGWNVRPAAVRRGRRRVRRVLAAETWFKAGKVYRGKLTSSGAPADLVADLVALAIELAPRSAWSPQALELRVAQAMGPTWARRLDLLWPVTGCRKAVNRVRKYRRETAGG